MDLCSDSCCIKLNSRFKNNSYWGCRVEKEVLVYGDSNEQFFEWYDALTSNPKGVVVLVHGGFWRQQHKLDQMHPLAAYFIKAGWAVANIEYRRAGCGGDWPAMPQDVNKAFALIRSRAQAKEITGPVVGIGHSVGGQLVLLAAEHQDVVVALAPVTDVTRTDREQLGEMAVQAFFGELSPAVAQSASPIHQLVSKQTILLIHGDVDQRVPIEHSRDYMEQLRRLNTNSHFWEIKGLDHFHIIEPSCEIWPRVLDYLENRGR